MKICRFKFNGEIYTGAVEGAYVTAGAVENAKKSTFKLTEIELLPISVPSKIVCVGRNYAAHAAELGNEVPTEPLLFLKAPSAVIADRQTILIPRQSSQVEHEGELAVVIRRECKNLSDSESWLDYVWGYTCLNDVTARDLQKRDVQFTRAKSFDTFCPLGSFLETEADVSDLRVTTKVNGVIKQDGRTSQMVFSVEFLIKYISEQMTLLPGDVIATGTPSGVSQLNNGDVCEIEIENVGLLSNPVRDGESNYRMKKCPQCQTDYFDNMLDFCLEDGAKLVSVENSASVRRSRPTAATDSPPNSEPTVAFSIENIEDSTETETVVVEQNTGINSETDKRRAIKISAVRQWYLFLETAPVIFALLHIYWQWLFLPKLYYGSFVGYVFSANFLSWLFLLVGGAAFGIISLKFGKSKKFAVTALVVLAINVLLYIVPK